MLKDMQEEIRNRQALLKRREDEEKFVVQTYEQLAMEEMQKEKQEMKQSADDARREMMQFMDYVKRLEAERIEEEKVLDALVDESRKRIEEKQNEAFCKLEIARQKLNEVFRLFYLLLAFFIVVF